MSELHKTMSNLVPKPEAWGKFSLPSPETYFLLIEFVDMRIRLPDPANFCSRIAELHRVSKSPTGKFGFHVPTFQGKYQQPVKWDSNWASLWSKLLTDILRRDLELNGPWVELEEVSDRTLSHVVPRLLGVLQSEGRTLKPCLIHADLWDGNIGIDNTTSNTYIFDSGAYYAHNEEELGMWRCERHEITSGLYKEIYTQQYPPSEPARDWDDRNRLYSVKFNMFHSAHHKGQNSRILAYNDMRYLVDKYAPFSTQEK
ncbi:MAG: hypothetical protein M1837_000385 [Sclerophora amabilis]|nr:MAG: hypothetical protein M1837_000385 [Sclerophora amabilis]